MCYWIRFASISLIVFTFCSSGILDRSLFFLPSGVVFWLEYQDRASIIKCIWEYSLLFDFMEEFEKDCCWVFLKCLVKFTREAICSLVFLTSQIFYYWFNILTSNWSVEIFSLSFSLGTWYASRNFSFFFRLSSWHDCS